MSSKFINSPLLRHKHLGSERAARAYVRNDGSWYVESHVNYDGMEWNQSGLKENQFLA